MAASESRMNSDRPLDDNLPLPDSHISRLRTTSRARPDEADNSTFERKTPTSNGIRQSAVLPLRDHFNLSRRATSSSLSSHVEAPVTYQAATLVSPPRYATRGSLGSVAFSPGKSPGSSSKQAYKPSRQYENTISSDQIAVAPSFENASEDVPSQSHEHYQQYYAHHTSSAPEASMELELSPDMQELEDQLAEQAPITPDHRHQQRQISTNSSSNGSQSSAFVPKKRAPPTPLDLSPPRPQDTRSREQQHVAQHQQPERTMPVRLRKASEFSSSPPPAFAPSPGAVAIADVSSSSSPPTGGSNHRQPYTGLGLGMPFKHSTTSDSLSSIVSSASSGRGLPHTYAGRLASPELSGAYPSSSLTSTSSSHIRRQRSASDILSSPEDRSPLVDRRGLVGLGELSTPRWTAAIHERRWNQHPLPAPMPYQQDPDERAEAESNEGWEGSVLNGYMDEKENDRYTAYRKSLPAAESYRSFSDFAATQNSNNRNGQMSTSSSGYSLEALPIPESSSSGSSNSEAGAFYTPSFRNNIQQDPLASYQIPDQRHEHHESPADTDTFKAPKSRRGIESLDSSTASTILSPASKTRAGTVEGSRTSSRSTSTSTSASASQQSSIRKSESSKESKVPSYMKSTRASSSKRSSMTGLSDLAKRSSDLPSSISAEVGDDRVQWTGRARYSSPPQQQQYSAGNNATSFGRAPQAQASSGHSRQSSLSSVSGKKHVPKAINTGRTAEDLPARRVNDVHYSGKTSHSPAAIAHNILRQTRGHFDVDLSSFAKRDEPEADVLNKALDKLDGISNSSSSKVSRAISASSFKGVAGASAATATEFTSRGPSGGTLSRKNSKSSMRTTSPQRSRPSSIKSQRKSEEQQQQSHAPPLQPKSPLRTNSYTTNPALSPPNPFVHQANFNQAFPSPSNLLPTRSVPIPNGDIATAGQLSTFNSPTVSFSHGPSAGPIRRESGRRPSSSSGEPLTPSLSSKRSSSASLAFGTSTSGSRDSTSATSISAYGSPAQSKNAKSRRGSGSSDVSSVHSTGEGLLRSDRSTGCEGNEAEQAFAKQIPPVPPLPKDWEAYRSANTGDHSAPTSASTSSFKERDRDASQAKLSGMQSLGLAEYRVDRNFSKRAASMEKPAGPRPLRDPSNSSIPPTDHESTSLESLPSLPSPATTAASTTTRQPERQTDVSKTPTKAKWSLSSALGLNRSPPMPTSSSQTSSLSSFLGSNLEKSTSHHDLASEERRSRKISHRSSLVPSGATANMPQRKLASVPDIKSLAAGTAQSAPTLTLPHSASAHQIGDLTDRHRQRTDSLSSTGTANGGGRNDGPSVVATSPGRSRSSLLSSRRTPSGIPFFNRRPSAQQTTSTLSSPAASQKSSASRDSVGLSTPQASDEKTGRRSILGINLFGRSSARKSLSLAKDAELPPSPRLPQEYKSTNNSVTSFRAGTDERPSELGVRSSAENKRSSVGNRASSLMGRKRGKTLPSSEQPVKPESVNLPPLQINALPASTTSRLSKPTDDMAHSKEPGASSNKRPLPVPPRTHRPSRVGDSLFAKDPLPTITGSPSVAGNKPADSADTSGQASKPNTPTKIPRLSGSRSNVSSPQYLQPTVSPPDDSAEGLNDRRGSLKPGSGISSSVPYSSMIPPPGTSVSSSSTDEPPQLVSSTSGKSEGQDRRRVLGYASSQVPVLSTSRTSGKYQSVPSSSVSEKRRSWLSQEDNEPKSARLPLRVASHTVDANAVSSGSSLPTRVRTRTSDAPITAHRGSSTVEGLPTSKSMGSNLVSKLSIPTRMSKSATTASLRQSPAPSDAGGRSTSSSRYGTPVGEDEIKGDEEMMEFVQRQRTKQASRGMSEEEIDRLFTFPAPIAPSEALSPQSAMQLYRQEMCEYELEEILEYKQVFYVGRLHKKKMAIKSEPTNNFGYDDERGDYQIIEGDHIVFRYEIIDTLGKGSFGQVLRCRDHQTGEMVAVKIIRNKKRFHHQALVEIKVLENLKRWDPEEKNCLLRIGDSFTFRGHLCITTELLGINLYELIKANSFRGFSTSLIRRFTVQILASLSLLRHHRVVHCDLKPENILLKHPAKSAIKVIDFGSSCFENEKVYTYIQSRFYRSPEVILGMNYHMAIDMWSLGCILAELYTGMPIFPGENEASQLACIMEVLGVPDKHLVDRSSRKKLFFDSTGNPRSTVDSKGRRRRPGAKTLQSVLKCDDELFVDFIAKCLTWDPDRRLKPGPALRHPFCAKGRSLSSSVIPPRSSTTSTRSLLRSTNISTPRRLEKKALESSSVYSTPSTRYEPSVPSTAPVQRMRTTSTAVPSSVGPSYSSYRSYAK